MRSCKQACRPGSQPGGVAQRAHGYPPVAWSRGMFTSLISPKGMNAELRMASFTFSSRPPTYSVVLGFVPLPPAGSGNSVAMVEVQLQAAQFLPSPALPDAAAFTKTRDQRQLRPPCWGQRAVQRCFRVPRGRTSPCPLTACTFTSVVCMMCCKERQQVVLTGSCPARCPQRVAP